VKNTTRLAIVDDQQLFRKGLISLLKEFPELDIRIEASNGEELLALLKKTKVDVVMLDLEMPKMDGIETASHLKQKYPELKILILTMHNEEEFVVHLLEKGVHGFLIKDQDINTVIDAIQAVRENGYYFNDRISGIVIRNLVKTKKIKPVFSNIPLSEKEIEIIRMICKEKTNKEIGETLFISSRTVEGHREKILQKTKAKNTAGIVMYAVKNNLLE
jgi:two-component system response regulator DegU